MRPLVSLSPFEPERFGVVAARCAGATAQNLEEILEFCRAARVELLIVRCDAVDFSAVHAIEEASGRLMDTLVYYERDVALRSLPEPPSPTIVRPLGPDEARAVRGVAAAAFAGYLGHYHTDPRLDRAKADETYADWAYRICSSRVAGSEVWVAERGGDVVGFLAVQEVGSEEVEIVLNGVAPASQRSGVYRLLLDAAVDWSRDRAAKRLIISTQLNNQRAQRAWIRAGFQPRSAQQTFHVWFPR